VRFELPVGSNLAHHSVRSHYVRFELIIYFQKARFSVGLFCLLVYNLRIIHYSLTTFTSFSLRGADQSPATSSVAKVVYS